MHLRHASRRRLRTAGGRVLAATAIAASALALCLSVVGSAASPDAARPSPQPGDPTPTPSEKSPPACADFNDCPSPSPTIIVVSPVAGDSPTPAGTPAYLIGLSPSPSDPGSVISGSPVPLGGAANELPSPVSDPASAGSADNGIHSGLPLPFLAAGILLAVAAAGALLLALAPREREVTRPAAAAKPATPVMFTPYGPGLGESSLPRRRPARAKATKRPGRPKRVDD